MPAFIGFASLWVLLFHFCFGESLKYTAESFIQPVAGLRGQGMSFTNDFSSSLRAYQRAAKQQVDALAGKSLTHSGGLLLADVGEWNIQLTGETLLAVKGGFTVSDKNKFQSGWLLIDGESAHVLLRCMVRGNS